MRPSIAKTLLSVLSLGAAGMVFAQTGVQGGGGTAADPSLGDFRYQVVPQDQKCSTTSGAVAACSTRSPGTPPIVEVPATSHSVVSSGDQRRVVGGEYCGNGMCDANETAESCAADCGGTSPTGVGAQIGDGSCAPQPYPAAFAVSNRPQLTCKISGTLGTGFVDADGRVGFGTIIPVTTTANNGVKAELSSGNCPGRRELSASIEMICANGVFQPVQADCTCVTAP